VDPAGRMLDAGGWIDLAGLRKRYGASAKVRAPGGLDLC